MSGATTGTGGSMDTDGEFRSQLFDAGVVVALFVAGLFEAFLRPVGEPFRKADLWDAAATVAIVLPLAWRRRWPIPVMGVTGVLFFMTLLIGYDSTGGSNTAQLIAVYSVGVYASRPAADRARLLMGVVVVAGFLWTQRIGQFSYAEIGLSILTWIGAAIFGETVYIRRRYQIALEERARLLEAERDQQAQQAVQEERARISRELHDVWAHTLSLVVVQAGAAQEVFDESPELAREALARIQQAGRQALAEVRRLIGSDSAEEGFDRSPAPGFRDLDRLVGELRSAGLPVDLSVTGSVDDLSDDVGLSAYRIVQQALTNALSHGGPGVSASVDVLRTGGELRIRVVDDGLGAAAVSDPDHHGRGLIGMRERVALFGGDLKAGPRPEGGFEISARIPIGVDA